ncbi:hypothetical protein [Fretibacterium sp. OH1220_COT-178]|uniref:hypothetical protein n=1 Tax=Fretibacterium sp. OH1220_COT-178 TaxID=2491047 RepID=UPI000F5E6522|nr:hypothetical protein [Fretibacterium sp. OH1220_COT-178]RRD63959.1 hypothetical protein EII26_09250 [Fretibacterium sp. OH1220_COT-178]
MSVIMSFFVVLLILAIGDIVSTKTKAFVPSVFVAALLFVLGFWYGWFPLDVVEKAGMTGPIVSISMYVIIVHMGTLMSIRELCAEWKTIAIAAAALAGMVGILVTVGRMLIGWDAVAIGTPPLSGGLVAAIMMAEAATKKGLPALAVLGTVIYVVQGFVGYPLTALCLKFEGKRLLHLRKTDPEALPHATASAGATQRKGLLPPLPDKYQTTFTHLATIALVACVSDYAAAAFKSWLIGMNPAYGAYALHPLVVCLIFGAIAAELGIVERRPLIKAGSFGFMLTAIMGFIMGMLNKATPEMMTEILFPLAVVVVVGVSGLLIGAFLMGKLLGYTGPMAMALSLTALYGFPPNYILTDEASKALAENKEEYDFLMDQMLPKMLVGGFVTVTITSVILAGIFINLL